MSEPKEFDIYGDEFGDLDAFKKGERADKYLRSTPTTVIEKSAYDALAERLTACEQERNHFRSQCHQQHEELASLREHSRAYERAIAALKTIVAESGLEQKAGDCRWKTASRCLSELGED